MLENILELKDEFDIFLFDMYGVLWDGKKAPENALKAAEALRKEGKKVIVLSNAPLVNEKMKVFYTRRGILEGKHYDEVVTSGDVVRDIFLHDDRKLKYYQFGEPNKGIFEGSKYVEVSNPKEADFIYIGAPRVKKGDVWEYTTEADSFILELKKFLALDKPLICANPDLRAFEGDVAVLEEGFIAQKYMEMGGEVEFIGKPYPIVYDYALRDFPDADDSRILMIGDTLETDILGGNSYGVKTALVIGGMTSYNAKNEGFEDVREYAEEVGIIPDYFVKQV